MKKRKQLLCIAFLVVLAIQGSLLLSNPAYAADSAANTTLRFPETGSKTKTANRLTIDYSHMDQGYVIVRAKKSNKQMQLSVSHGSDTVHYEMNGNGKHEIIPLQFGSGEYKFTLLISRKKGCNRYDRAGTITLKCNMPDESSCFLYPNQYVNYEADSPLVKETQRLCKDLNTPMEVVKTICSYVRSHFCYDWVKCNAIKSNQAENILPDIAATWKTGKGICQDLSALTCAMLRSQGIHATLVIGSADGSYHAWVVIMVDGKNKFFDPSFSARIYRAERYY
ncbi:MAG: transglutaminase domain-containing protein [Clostridia bacterium]|nr:transglutaminase domain-containing protein [Clostridia bacterium]